MEADNIHATIELAKKNILRFHPSGSYTILRKASIKNPYGVHETEDLVDSQYLKSVLVKNATARPTTLRYRPSSALRQAATDRLLLHL